MDTGKLIDSMKRVVKSELGSYDTTATVKRVEGNTAWVHIPGGVDETPVRLTMNAKEGDNVQVRVSDGKAFLAGNVSAPPTDDTTAEAAKALANRAAEDAGRAKSAADIAETYATSAQASAAQSATILEGMEQAATAAGTTLDGIYADAAEAKATTDEINDYADTAGKTVTQILEDGETAGVAAQAASEAANSALVGLSTVEDVVGVLNWITEHGTMTLTSDVTVNPAHVYFVVDPAGDYVVGGTHYSIVSDPKDADLSTYYELTVDESVENYVATHVAVDPEGLWLIPEDNATPASSGKKILIATGAGSTYITAGTYIIEKVGGVDTVLASFTASGATVGLNSEGNTEFNSSGVTVKENGLTLANFTSSGAVIGQSSGNHVSVDSTSVDINDGSTMLATFGSSGAQIGKSGSSHSIIDANGQRFYASDGTTQLANIGYGSGQTQGGGTATAPYYTFGERFSGSTIGNYSIAEGSDIIASGAESHAEGRLTQANGFASHAEGYSAKANGAESHAGGYGTIASKQAQTAIGTFNVEDTSTTTTHPSGSVNYGKYAVIVGNGTYSGSQTSNALTVDWSGNVEAAGDITDGSGKSIASLSGIQNTYGILTNMTGNLSLSTSEKKLTLNNFTGSGCSLSSNGIKVSKAGIYEVSGTAYVHTGFTVNDIVHLLLYKNSTQVCEFAKRMMNASPYENISISPYILSLNANDVVYLYANNQTGSRGTIYASSTRTYMMLRRLA